jgi:hypothetical protein
MTELGGMVVPYTTEQRVSSVKTFFECVMQVQRNY